MFSSSRPLTAEGKLTKGIETRLKELRQSFSQRTELVKKRDLALDEDEKLESSDEEITELRKSGMLIPLDSISMQNILISLEELK